jgi:hypothetical protein
MRFRNLGKKGGKGTKRVVRKRQSEREREEERKKKGVEEI